MESARDNKSSVQADPFESNPLSSPTKQESSIKRPKDQVLWSEILKDNDFDAEDDQDDESQSHPSLTGRQDSQPDLDKETDQSDKKKKKKKKNKNTDIDLRQMSSRINK